MLELQKKHHDARMEQDKALYKRQIRIVDTQIDRRVYDLYVRADGGKGEGGRRALIAVVPNKRIG